MTRTRWIAAIALMLGASLRIVGAHPAGTTTIVVAIDRGRATDLLVTSDADALRLKIGALCAMRGARCQGENLAAIADYIDVRADGETPVALTFAGAREESKVAAVHLSAALPAGTRQITLASSFIYGSYALTVKRPGVKDDVVQWLNGTERSAPVAIAGASTSAGWRELARDVWLGYSHILPGGIDHILFVLGLFLLNVRPRAILLQVSAFTVAHSITLGLTLYGVVSLPSSIVEPMIALSIVYVACENLMTTTLRPWRIGLVFLFGLLHGMGFAEALAHLHLERSQFLTTLVTFNVGVEAGQLTVIAMAALVVRALALPPSRHRAVVVRPASIAIALVGAVWVVQRLMA